MRKNTGEPRRARRRRGKRRAARRPRAAATGSQTTAEAVQLAVGLLTASLDSPPLQAQAMEMLIPDPAALGDLLAGLHIVSQLLLHQLHQATGQPASSYPATTRDPDRDQPGPTLHRAGQRRAAGNLAASKAPPLPRIAPVIRRW